MSDLSVAPNFMVVSVAMGSSAVLPAADSVAIVEAVAYIWA